MNVNFDICYLFERRFQYYDFYLLLSIRYARGKIQKQTILKQKTNDEFLLCFFEMANCNVKILRKEIVKLIVLKRKKQKR